ncbi:MAG: glycosyltransferase family 39 protein [Burkholderiales bacterium]|nr:glycosyltransferase family 39 protein [Burkholderiales bacterium]
MTAPASRGLALAVLIVLTAAWFAGLGHRKLFRTDEGRYAEIAREMVATGDWLTPRLNGYQYFEKPPLQYWATAAAFTAFGPSEWTARLWTALTGFACILFTWYAANRVRGPPVGLFAAAVTASAFLFAGLGHFASLDMGVAAFLAIAVFAFVLAQRDPATPAERRRWMVAAWAAMALATLSKGLIGFVLPAGAVAAYVLLERDWRLLGRMHWLAGSAVFATIAVPWFVAVSLANREFFDFFFVHEHFERFLTRAHGRYAPWWYFVPILLAGLVPWTLMLFPALARLPSAEPGVRFRPLRFLAVWAGVVFVFFSASSSKLPSYILPVVPALSVLIGTELAVAGRRWILAQAVVGAIGGLVAVLAAPHLVPRWADDDLPAGLLQAALPWIVAAAAAFTAGSVASAGLEWRGRRTGAVLALALGALASVLLASAAYERLSPVYSAYDSVARAAPGIPADAPFFLVETFDHSLLFYLRRTATMVVYPDELAVPIGWEPRDFIADRAAFEEAWKSAGRAAALIRARDFPEWQERGLPMKVLARDPRRVIVAKP